MRVIIVRGYKDFRDAAPVTLGRPRADDVYVNREIGETMRLALEAEGLTSEDVISVTAVPWQVNGRDTNSIDYHIVCRR